MSKRRKTYAISLTLYYYVLFLIMVYLSVPHPAKTLKTRYIYLVFIYNQIPPQSEENNILHKNSIDKILV